MRHQLPTPGLFRTPGDLAVFTIALIGLIFVGFAIASAFGGPS